MLNAIIISTGLWRAVLSLPCGDELPFNFNVTLDHDTYTIELINGEEVIKMENVSVEQDSVIMQFPVYETELRAAITDHKTLSGVFINHTRTENNTMPFNAVFGVSEKYPSQKSANQKVAQIRSRYAVTLGEEDSPNAIGVFEQRRQIINGTFLHPSGDYRYLSGVVKDDSLYLSGFDGTFIYLFKASVQENKLTGIYCSGWGNKKIWNGYYDLTFEIANPDSITSVITADPIFNFEFPNTDSTLVSLKDSLFLNKIVIVQILGTWCPNCLDESKYLNELYAKFKDSGLQVVGLAFEKTDDFNRAASNVERLKSRFSIQYPVLVATNRSRLKEVMPQIHNFLAFPTTIVLSRDHRVHKVHAGFSGPATGEAYTEFVRSFEKELGALLKH